MLKLWGKNRKRAYRAAQTAAAGWGSRRRLGFEAMEGRLMLSGDAPGYLFWDAYSPDFRIAPYPLGEMALKVVPADYIDGGFILPGTVLSGYSVHGSFDPVTNRASIGDFAPSTPTTGSVHAWGSGDVDFNFGEVYLDTPAIPFIEFPGTNGDLDTTFVDQPANPPQMTDTVADEGGAIPINPILAFVGRTENWRSGERLASKVSSHAGERLSSIPNLGQPAQSRDFAGEWARPMMLEMAGGEPASIRQPAAPEHERTLILEDDGDSRVRRPLSSGAAAEAPANDSRAARDDDGSRRGADTTASEGPNGANGRSQAASLQPESLILASHIAGADLQSESNAFANAELINVYDSASTTSAVNEPAYAEVYDELGASEAAGAEALFHRDSWRDSWKVTPLLMILALERIAASNSRRAKKESSASPRRPQSPSPTSADLNDSF